MAISLKDIVWLRLNGQSWEEAATFAGLPVQEVMLYPVRRMDEWNEALQECSAIMAKTAEMGAVVALEKLLKSSEERVQQTAATALLKYRVEMLKLAMKDEVAQAKREKQKQLAAKALEALDEAEPKKLPAAKPKSTPARNIGTVRLGLPTPTTSPATKTLDSFLGNSV
jgi:hypothetical protein